MFQNFRFTQSLLLLFNCLLLNTLTTWGFTLSISFLLPESPQRIGLFMLVHLLDILPLLQTLLCQTLSLTSPSSCIYMNLFSALALTSSHFRLDFLPLLSLHTNFFLALKHSILHSLSIVRHEKTKLIPWPAATFAWFISRWKVFAIPSHLVWWRRQEKLTQNISELKSGILYKEIKWL